MNKLTNFAKLPAAHVHKTKPRTQVNFWSGDCDGQLKALFEAIIAADIHARPSPDDLALRLG